MKPRVRKLPLSLITVALVGGVLAGCGGSTEGTASPSDIPTLTTETTTETTTPESTTETTTPESSSSEEETTTTEESVEESVEEDYSEDYSDDDSGYSVDWADVLPGVWVAPQPYGGEELWTFNGRTGGATWNYWPRGVGVGNPLDNGVPAPINIGHLYSVDGDTLSVHSALSGRTYYNLTEVDSDCFSADFDGDTVMFCRWTG